MIRKSCQVPFKRYSLKQFCRVYWVLKVSVDLAGIMHFVEFVGLEAVDN
jgi:hypothetical protein